MRHMNLLQETLARLKTAADPTTGKTLEEQYGPFAVLLAFVALLILLGTGILDENTIETVLTFLFAAGGWYVRARSE